MADIETRSLESRMAIALDKLNLFVHLVQSELPEWRKAYVAEMLRVSGIVDEAEEVGLLSDTETSEAD